MGLDAVEIIVGWENAFDIQLSDREIALLRTPRQAIDLIASKIGAVDREPGVRLGLRAYHRIRQAFGQVLNVDRSEVRLDRKLRQLLPARHDQDVWSAIFFHAGFPNAPPWRLGTGVLWRPITIQDVVVWVVANHPSSLLDASDHWTYSQVRAVVRAVITETVGAENFNDDDDFITDLGIS